MIRLPCQPPPSHPRTPPNPNNPSPLTPGAFAFGSKQDQCRPKALESGSISGTRGAPRRHERRDLGACGTFVRMAGQRRAGGGGRSEPPRFPLERFRAVVAEAIDSIPEHLHRRIENVEVVVEDEPDEETLIDMGLDPEADTLFGLYQGTPISERGASFGNALPDRIVIYYLPLTDVFADEYHLRREIRRTVIHEIGHYFGLSDREIRGMGY